MALIKTSEDLWTRFKDAQNGERILLDEGVFEGQFNLVGKEGVEIVGHGAGRSIVRGGFGIKGHGCTISNLSINLDGLGDIEPLIGCTCTIGIILKGSRNKVQNVTISGAGTCVHVSGNENKLEWMTLSSSGFGIQLKGQRNVLDEIQMSDIRRSGLTLNDNAKENIVQNVTGSNVLIGIMVGGANNNLFNIHLAKDGAGAEGNGAYGVLIPSSSPHNRISYLTCVGYSGDEWDWGIHIRGSYATVKDSDCGLVCVEGRNAALSRVHCGEVIRIGRKAKGVTLRDCTGQELRCDPEVTVEVDNCNFGG